MTRILCLAFVASLPLLAVISYTYDAGGRLTKIDYGNGSVLTYTYDKAGNLVGRSLNNGGGGGGGASCTYAATPGGQTFPAAGGSGAISIMSNSGCAWNTSGTPNWVTFANGSGSGAGSAAYTVTANSGAARSAVVTVAGISFTVEQSAASTAGMAAAGSLAQVTSEGAWDFLLNLVNLGSSPALTRVNFADNNGAPLTLPITFPQSASSPGPLIAATLDRSINPNAQLLIASTGPLNAPQLVGWGQLLATAGGTGFGIFSAPSLGWNAVVPLETRNASKYFLAFDNTSAAGSTALATGVAVANVASAAASIPVIIRDDTGTQIFSGSISLGPQGHKSFMLNDPQAGFPETNGKRGTVEIQTPSGGQISVLGLRANGPALTTLPLLASTDKPGGAIAHATYNGGFTSVFYLANTGTSSALFNLSFFDESGNPLSVPLLLPQSDTNTTASVLTRTLTAGAMLVVQTLADDAAASVSGSAQLTSTGVVSGFEIFRWTTFGQEASVPLETRTPGSFVLAFDDTNGLTTGVALSNVATSAASVTARIYDDAGALMQTASVDLSKLGHTSFLLPDRYPATANKRGIVEFVVPPGGQLSAVGLRAKSDGTLTTIPVLAK